MMEGFERHVKTTGGEHPIEMARRSNEEMKKALEGLSQQQVKSRNELLSWGSQQL